MQRMRCISIFKPHYAVEERKVYFYRISILYKSNDVIGLKIIIIIILS